MAVIITLVIIALVGVGTLALINTDAGRAGCGALMLLLAVLAVGVISLFFLMVFGIGCMAVFS